MTLRKNLKKRIMAKVKPKYKEIISKLPEFEKGDRFNRKLVVPMVHYESQEETIILQSK